MFIKERERERERERESVYQESGIWLPYFIDLSQPLLNGDGGEGRGGFCLTSCLEINVSVLSECLVAKSDFFMSVFDGLNEKFSIFLKNDWQLVRKYYQGSHVIFPATTTLSFVM